MNAVAFNLGAYRKHSSPVITVGPLPIITPCNSSFPIDLSSNQNAGAIDFMRSISVAIDGNASPGFDFANTTLQLVTNTGQSIVLYTPPFATGALGNQLLGTGFTGVVNVAQANPIRFTLNLTNNVNPAQLAVFSIWVNNYFIGDDRIAGQ